MNKIILLLKRNRIAIVVVVIIVGILAIYWLKSSEDAKPALSDSSKNQSDAQYMKERLEFLSAADDKEEFFKKQEKKRSEHLQKFLDKGWKLSNSPPPNKLIIDLDDKAIPLYEKEMQEHLQTNTFAPAQSAKIVTLILKTKEEKTQYMGLEALARSNSQEAQGALISLFDQLDDSRHKSKIIGSLMPKEPNDEQSRFLLGVLGQKVEPRLKREAAMSLLVMALIHGKGKPESVDAVYNKLLDGVPEDYKVEFNGVYKTLQKDFLTQK